MARKAPPRARLWASATVVVVVTAVATSAYLPHVGAQATSTSSIAEEAIEECPAEGTACKEDPDCVLCSSGVTPDTQDEWESCLASVSTEEICTAFGITLCCMDELTPGVSCMANEAFLGYYDCVIRASTHEECPEWSCADIGVSFVPGNDTDTSTHTGGSGELTGITSSDLTPSPSAAPLTNSTDGADDVCSAEIGACQQDSVCVDCSNVVTDETESEWDSCLSSVFTDDLCTAYGVTLCCMDELSTNDCMLNEPFLGFYQCTIKHSTGQECPDWSCSEIGASIGVIDDDDPDAGTGELTGVTSSVATTPSPAASVEDAAGSGVAVSGQRLASAGMGSVVFSSFAVVVVGYIAMMAALG